MSVFISFGDIIVMGGLSSALIQAPATRDKDYSTAFWMSIALSLAAFVILFLGAPIIASFYSEPGLTIPLRVLALQFFPLTFNSIQTAKTTKALNLKPVFVGTITAEIIASLVAVALAVFGLGIWSLVAQQLVSAVAACAITALMIKWRPRFEFDWASGKSMLLFGCRVMGTELLSSFSTSLYTLIVGKSYAQDQLGYYSQGQKYPLAISEVVTGALSPVLLASFSKNGSGNVKGIARSLTKVNQYSLAILCPITIAAISCASPLVSIVLTEKWLPCVVILQIYCLVALFKSLSLVGRQAILASGYSSGVLFIAMIKTVTSLAFLFLVIYWGGGITDVSYCWLLSGVVEWAVTIIFCKEVINYSVLEHLCDVLPYILPVLFCYVLTVILEFSNVVFCLTAAFLFYLAAVCSYWLIKSKRGVKENGQ